MSIFLAISLVVFGGFVLCYIILCLVYYIRQDSLVYLPSRDFHWSPKDSGIFFEDVFFRSEDGVVLHGWWVPVEGASATFLFVHGNQGCISDRKESIRLLNQLGFSVFVFDYRGYGKSQGVPEEYGTYLDAQAAFDTLVDKLFVDPSKIIIHGRSLGGGIASHLCTKREAAGLVLESTFTSLPEMARRNYPHLPTFLCKTSYPVLKHLQNRLCNKALVIHSPGDEVVPYAMGIRLFREGGGEIEFKRIHGSHSEGFLDSRPAYDEVLTGFADSVVNEKPGEPA